jgi:NAD(P)-dependent dehydrogenase (short-subunit alcohol dehydrogenase family)
VSVLSVRVRRCGKGTLLIPSPPGMYTKQGYTLQFGTNVRVPILLRSFTEQKQCLGHQRLITLLLPTLHRTTKRRQQPSRVIITSSAGHTGAPTKGVDLASIKRLPSTRTSTDGQLTPGKNERAKWVEYGQSKWGNIACAKYLHARFGPTLQMGVQKEDEAELISVAVHPGESSNVDVSVC